LIVVSLLAGRPARAQQKTDSGGAAAMQESLAKQRLSIEKQLRGARHSNFFNLPPPEPIGADMPDAPEEAAPGPAPDCDALPDAELSSLIDEAARREDLKPDLLRGVIRQESGARPCAVSPKGAQGLMQLMPATSQQFGVSDPFDPRQNVQAGAKFLKQLLTRYGGDAAKALAAYNAGPVRVDQAGAIPQIPETIRYVTSILSMLPH
jgi:soluble lytic murein transglycosylase-like protein